MSPSLASPSQFPPLRRWARAKVARGLEQQPPSPRSPQSPPPSPSSSPSRPTPPPLEAASVEPVDSHHASHRGQALPGADDGTPSPAAPADAREQIGRQRSVRRRRRARGRARRLGGGRGGPAGSGSWCIARLAGGERGEIDQPPPTESTAAVAAPGTGPREHRREALRSARPRPNPSLGPQLLSQPMPTVER